MHSLKILATVDEIAVTSYIYQPTEFSAIYIKIRRMSPPAQCVKTVFRRNIFLFSLAWPVAYYAQTGIPLAVLLTQTTSQRTVP